MSEDIEKLKMERDAAIAILHGTALSELLSGGEAIGWDCADEVRAAVEAFKPKLRQVEAFARVFIDDNSISGVYTDEGCRKNLPPAMRIAHLREVTPVEWERWVHFEECGEVQVRTERGAYLFTAISLDSARLATRAHNAQMQRVTGTEGK
jgi:hypothetical protein